MIKYGLISNTDARTLEKTIDLICNGFNGEIIRITEIGLYNCETSNGIMDYAWQQHPADIKSVFYTGIDNQKDKEIIAPEWMNLIIGNSNEVYNQLEDNSQHLIFVDGCHCFAHVISDFFCYADKVKVGGCIAFHDTGKHIAPFKDFQHGDKNNPDAFISVRKALNKIGMLDDFSDNNQTVHFWKAGELDNWELIFDEADETNKAGGICVFKKLY